MNSNYHYMLNLTSEAISKIKGTSNRILIAIDGMSGSGKSTFAEILSTELNATLIHADDFFLRPEQRTKERLFEIGGNIDAERILSEIINPIINNSSFIYKPFNCHTMDFCDKKEVYPADVVILEGSYSCHPLLYPYFDIHIFLSTDRLTQVSRLLLRGGYEKTKVFLEKWIPMENKYFSCFDIKEKCELKFTT